VSRILLSAGVGVPIALLAMSLWFLVEMFDLSGRRPGRVRVSALLVTVVLLGLVAARFVKYA
jgi:hypothetical protein